jgi:hypothetical protein
MICYQEFNTKSPLNGLAAKWVEQNVALLPIDTSNVAPPARSSSTTQPAARVGLRATNTRAAWVRGRASGTFSTRPALAGGISNGSADRARRRAGR